MDKNDDREVKKEAYKEAMKEFLEEQKREMVRSFGEWALKIIAVALAVLVFKLTMKANGWSHD